MHDAREMYQGDKPALALLFSCGGRHIYLGTRTGEEYGVATGEVNDSDLKVAGFYSYGEIAPLRPGVDAHFHNTTFVVVLLGEE